MPYSNLPDSPEIQEKMERCVADVQASGKPKQAAIAICYSSITGKKVLLSPYPVEEKAIGDLIPPKAAQENAARVLRWRDEHPDEIRGMTRVGWTRANQLAKGESLSWDVVGRMAQFARHRENAEVAAEYEGEPWRDAGRVAWNGWGGDEGIAWAQRMMERRREGAKAHCSVKGCPASPTQLVSVKGAVLPYCDEHLPGAKDVLARHSIKIEGVRSAEQVWVDASFLAQDINTVKLGYDEKEEHTGIILALKPPAYIADEIAVDGGLLPTELHVTLVYLGETADLDKDEILILAERLAQAIHPFTAKLDGTIRFAEGAVALNVNAPYIPELRQQLVETLRGLDHEVTDIHGFTPHLTIKYVEPDERFDDEVWLPDEDVEFNELWLFWGGEQVAFPMLSSKALQFITREGQVIPISGPSSGGGGSAGQSGEQVVDVDALRRRIQQQTHSLQDVVDGKYSVGVEGRGGRDIERARSLGMYTTVVNNIPIFARTEEDARPLVDYLLGGGGYGTLRFSELLGYTPEQIAEYEQFLDLSKQGSRKENEGDEQAEPTSPPPTELDDTKAATPDLATLAAAIADRAGGKATAEDVQRDLLEPWLTTVFGTPASNQMQKVAARTFGFPDPPGMEELKINWQLLYPMGEMYNITQEYLAARGFKEWETVPVYRPYVPTEARPKQWKKGDEVRIKLLPLTSWTLDINEAVKVAEFLGAPGTPAFVLKTFIPIKSVVSTPNTGIGIPGTSEVVLAGGEYESLVEAVFV